MFRDVLVFMWIILDNGKNWRGFQNDNGPVFYQHGAAARPPLTYAALQAQVQEAPKLAKGTVVAVLIPEMAELGLD